MLICETLECLTILGIRVDILNISQRSPLLFYFWKDNSKFDPMHIPLSHFIKYFGRDPSFLNCLVINGLVQTQELDKRFCYVFLWSLKWSSMWCSFLKKQLIMVCSFSCVFNKKIKKKFTDKVFFGLTRFLLLE